jgi:hypothetical protein
MRRGLEWRDDRFARRETRNLEGAGQSKRRSQLLRLSIHWGVAGRNGRNYT